MELRQIEAFVATAETRNFTRAAALLHRSQPALSQQVRQLEDDLGLTLFTRTKRSVVLSANGREALRSAKEILRWRDEFLGLGKVDQKVASGRLSVGTTGAATVHLWANIYKGFVQEYRNIRLDIRTTERTRDTFQDVARGELDLAFTPEPPTGSKLQFMKLGTQEAVLAAAIDHPMGSGHAVDGLAGEAFILPEKGMGMRVLADAFFKRADLKPRVVLESNDWQMIAALIEVGFGIGFLPDWSIRRELKTKTLRRISTPGVPMTQAIGLAFRADGLTAAARIFLDFSVSRGLSSRP